jgi:cell division protein FtsW
VRPEKVLAATTLALVCFGLVMVYSASSSVALLEGSDPLSFVSRQAMFAVVGFGAYAFFSRVAMTTLKRFTVPALVVSGLMLVAVLVPHVGVKINGSHRWLAAPLVGQVQPSEFAKLALILWIAQAIARDRKRIATFKGILPYLIVTGLFSVLILAEPDLGTASAFGVVCLAMLFIAGARPGHLGGVIAVSGVAVAIAIAAAPYRRERLLSFLDPSNDSQAAGFQALQAQVAVGSGGIHGVGLGDGLQKAFYLPEAHTDMILATVGEELGLIGVCAVLVAICLIGWSAFRIAIRARDLHQQLLAVGLAALITVQAIDNVGAVLGVMPITGVPLPFVSYGGSSLIVLLACVGILVNIGRLQTRPRTAGARGDRGGGNGRPRDAGARGGRRPARARS